MRFLVALGAVSITVLSLVHTATLFATFTPIVALVLNLEHTQIGEFYTLAFVVFVVLWVGVFFVAWAVTDRGSAPLKRETARDAEIRRGGST